MKREIFDALRTALAERRLITLATVVRGSGVGRQALFSPTAQGPAAPEIGTLGDRRLDRAVAERAAGLVAGFRTERATFDGADGPAEVLVETHPPPPRLVVIGAVHTAIPLVEFAGRLGYETIVVDPRRAFATEERFAHADRLVREWPAEAMAEIGLHEATAVATLSHDMKLDLPALELALASPAFYVGALGSKRTHAKRAAALAERGVAGEAIARIHAPIGLDLGGRQPAEIALAVVAEIVASFHASDRVGM